MKESHIHWLCFSYDEVGRTLIHACAFYNQYEMLVYLIKLFKESSLTMLRQANDQYRF